MIPLSLSASSLTVYQACPARWVAENFRKTPTASGVYADLGTTCHTALENYVRAVYVDKTSEPSLDTLMDFYTDAHMARMGAPSGALFDDGVEMMKNWYPRSADLSDGREILSLETKDNFIIKSSAGPIKFNFIFDRMDRHEDGSIEVVDYKSVRARVSPEGLKDKIQSRCYGLAAQMMYPDAPKVWVTFDLLRYDPVGIVFTREENLATWRYVRHKAEEIIATEPDDAPEQINPECRFCIRKHECASLLQNHDAGSILALSDPLEAARKRMAMDYQLKALTSGIEELDAFILQQAEHDETDTYEDDDFTVSISARRTRMMKDSKRAATVLGPELMHKYGSLSVTNVDKILKNEVLTDEQEAELNVLVGYKLGNPSVKVFPKNPIDA